jgi:hypothetical protein
MPRGSRHRRGIHILRCPFEGCPKTFRGESGRTNHVRTVHPRADRHQVPVSDIQAPPSPTRSSPPRSLVNRSTSPELPQPRGKKTYHPFLNGKSSLLHRCKFYSLPLFFIGRPCNENGHYLPINTPPPPRQTAASGDWKPFEDEVQFKIADFLYRQEEMSQGNINHLLELWALSLMKHGSNGPFDSYKEIYDKIDAIEKGMSCYDKVLSFIADII